MKSMTQASRASDALRAAADSGSLEGSLIPAVFGCPYGHAAGIVTAPLPFGRCRECGTQMAVLDAGQLQRASRQAG